MLADLERHQIRDCSGCEKRLPWWTEEAAPLITQQLGLLVFHIVFVVLGIALCWCWQCLLTVGGNLLPRIVTPLDVTTVAWSCRHTQDVLQPAECPPAALQTSAWQWTARDFTAWYRAGSSYSLFSKIGVLSRSRFCREITLDHSFPQLCCCRILVLHKMCQGFVQLKWR
jgi:hypothetical protein